MLLDSVPAGVHVYTDPSASAGRYYFYAVVARNVTASLSDSSAQIDISLFAASASRSRLRSPCRLSASWYLRQRFI